MTIGTVARRAAMVTLSALAMFALLLAAAAIALGRYTSLVLYLAVAIVAVVVVAALWRPERTRRRAAEAALSPDLRPVRRSPRRPITFPLIESALVFAAWYVVAVVVDRFVTGATDSFTLAVIAPFAAFMLATLTIAGRHMAFRLTAEEDEPGRD